jgi:hypothetical protein
MTYVYAHGKEGASLRGDANMGLETLGLMPEGSRLERCSRCVKCQEESFCILRWRGLAVDLTQVFDDLVINWTHPKSW